MDLTPYLEGAVFKDRLAFLEESQWWTSSRLEAFQLAELRRVLTAACENVPFYRELFREKKLAPATFSALSDLRQLPLIDKEFIKSRPRDFLDETMPPESLMARTTGGSTGEPLTVYFDQEAKARDLANTFFYARVAGCDPRRQRSLRLYGDGLDVDAAHQIYWREEDNKLLLSAYHFSQKTCFSYLEKIKPFQPAYLHGRPSAVVPFCEMIRDARQRLEPKLSCVFLDGEFLPDIQRKLIEEVCGGRVYLTYGHTEGALLGFSCPRSRLIHMAPQVGIVELVDADGPASKEGTKGEVVVTGFNNKSFPLVRYRTGDIATVGPDSCACGRRMPLFHGIDGRIQDFILDGAGRPVPLTPALFNYNAVDWSCAHRFQAEQSIPGELLIRVVPKKDAHGRHDPESLSRIAAQLSSVLPAGFKIRMEAADDIPRTSRGKYRYLIQHLDMSAHFGRPRETA